MKRRSNQTYAKQVQSGYALILFVLAVVGIGGVVVVGFTQQIKQQADQQRHKHNQRVLVEAKQALLQYAYNYPQFNDNGPGILPCPDANNDGVNNDDCDAVGRFPWKIAEMNFYDARDSSNERLWYAVSDQFDNDGNPKINSNSTGTITVHDQSGQLMYQGSVAGIAAVIIAPGAEIERDGVLQVRNGVSDEDLDPANYLDIAGGRDNASFINGSDVDGFIQGPIEDSTTGKILVNDQIILITAQELIEVGEKATLQTYREALLDYDKKIDTDVGPGNHYPWLFNFNVSANSAVDPNLSDFPAAADFTTELDSWGRVPALFGKYFSATTSETIESDLRIELTLSYPSPPGVVRYSSGGSAEFDLASDVVIDVTRLVRDLKFTDLDMGEKARLSGDFTDPAPAPIVRFFWDEIAGDGWQQCAGDADHEDDCNRDQFGNPDPTGDNEIAVQVLRVTIALELVGVRNFDIDYEGITPIIENAAASNQHPRISASINASAIDTSTFPLLVTYEYDSNYWNEFNNAAVTGSLVIDDLLSATPLKLTMRYYPELPRWVHKNDWYEGMLMAYADNYKPGVGGTCSVGGGDCLVLQNSAGVANNKISLLVYAGQHNWVDGGVLNQLDDDLASVFDTENANKDDVYAIADADDATSNDRVLVICELGGDSECF